MEADEWREMQKHMINRALNSIKSMIESGQISADMALGLLAERSGQFSGKNDAPEYKRFKENSGLIYDNELFFDINYKMDNAMEYKFAPASQHDIHALYKLYQHLSNKEYDSPEQLKKIMKELVEGKRILELGSGPGFNLNVLHNLGARVSGIEIRKDLIGKISNVDVRCGDAEHLDDVFGDEQFDLIYSIDLFCTAVINQEKSGRIATQTYRHTKDGGTCVHQITYEKMELPFYLLGLWISNREAGINPEEMEEFFWNMPEDEKEKALYTNRCSLDLQDLVVRGFKIKEYSIENGQLNIVVRK